MTAVVRPYRGVSAEERRAERRARLKDACLDLVGESGVAAVTAEAVCGRAGLTKRYFYESFADREALLFEVMDEFFTDVQTEIVRAVAEGGTAPGERAHTIARVLIEFLERDRRRARLYIESAGQPTLRGRREQAYEAFTRLLLVAVAEPAADVSTDPATDPAALATDQAADPVTDRPASPDEDPFAGSPRALAALIVVAGTTQAVISWLQGGLDLSRESVIEQIAHMITAAVRP